MHNLPLILIVLTLALSLPACATAITRSPFGTTTSGEKVTAYTLSSPTGSSVTVLNYGGIVTEINVPDKSGKVSNVNLGFDNVQQYETQSPYFGALIGRVGNRIAGGKFTLEGKTYTLATNNGPNHLHGGKVGYDKRIWGVEEIKGAKPALKLTLTDPDGTEGYPGTVKVSVVYTMDGDTLRIEYEATTDKATPINLTNHAYFNLKDAGKSDVLSHLVQINADRYTPVDDTLIPTGKIEAVKNTPMDFTSPKAIGKDLQALAGKPGGYDHNFVLRGGDGKLEKAAVVDEPTTGRRMEVWTTEPGVQFYTGNFLDGKATGKGGAIYGPHHAFCLETQHFPDSVNHPNFPSTILKPGETYRSTTEYRFSVMR